MNAQTQTEMHRYVDPNESFVLDDHLNELARICDYHLYTISEAYTYASDGLIKISEITPSLSKVHWFFDNEFEYASIVPMSVFRSLRGVDKIRLAEGPFFDCSDSETFGFRLLAFIVYERIIDHNDVFAMINRRNVFGLIGKMVKQQVSNRQIEQVAKVIQEDPTEMITKCLTYWNSWKESRGNTIFK